MKGIIIAAGLGSRLMPHTDTKPKCLLDVAGKTILDRMLDVFQKAGIENMAIVRGYKKEFINISDISYYENIDYRNNNILHSLFYAEEAMEDEFIFSYSDIIYGADVLKKLIDCPADIALVADYSWQGGYIGRDQHPITEAELVKAENYSVTRVGKDVVAPNEASGEFIGLGKFSKKGSEILKKEFYRLKDFYKTQADQKFQNAKFFRKAYMTDMFQELIDEGYDVNVVRIDGGWHEIDTPQDLERANKFF
ncbi:phosphocholine cytidylyltransferase family protein [Patescibacteria group bacterium]|nr:phosphocholine cytidylyltransferase family protein [Patescibacteria group bacterium]